MSHARVAPSPAGRRELLLLAAVLLLATVLRVAWPSLTEFKFSEARLGALALELTQRGRLPLVGVPSSAGFDHSPISVYLYAPSFLAGANPIPATIYGGLVNVAAVALCWWLARRWPGGGIWAALVAALLFAASPWSVAFSRKIWQVAFVPLLTLAFAGLAVSALVQGRHWRLAWALVTLALLVQVHPSAVSLVPALLLWLVLFRKNVRLGPLLVGSCVGLLTTIPFLIHQSRSGWSALAALGALPAAVWDWAAIQLAWEMVTGRSIHALAGAAYPLLDLVPQLGWLFNLIGWLVVGAALWTTWRVVSGWRASAEDRRQAARVDLIVLGWLAFPVLFNLRHSLDLYLHFFSLVAPAAYLLVGRAAQAVVDSSARRRIAVALAAALVGFLALTQVFSLLLMGRFVASHDTPGGFGAPLGRYLRVADLAVGLADRIDAAEVLVVGQGDSPVVDETAAIFDLLLRDRQSVRFVDGDSAALFPPHHSLVLLAPGAGESADWYRSAPPIETRDGFEFLAQGGSAPVAGLDPVTGLRLFENGVEVQGYRWQADPVRNDNGVFWLLWQVLWQSPESTHFFVQLVDQNGQVQAQQDSVGFPAASRRKGDRIITQFDITLHEELSSQPVWARVGTYLFPQVVNVPLIDEVGNPAADTVLIGPLDGGP